MVVKFMMAGWHLFARLGLNKVMMGCLVHGVQVGYPDTCKASPNYGSKLRTELSYPEVWRQACLLITRTMGEVVHAVIP